MRIIFDLTVTENSTLFLFETVFQGNASVKDKVCRGAVLIGAEIAQSHELIAGSSGSLFHKAFRLTARLYNQTVRIDIVEEIFVAGIGFGISKEIVIQTHFGLNVVFSIDPVNSTSDLAAVRRITASCGRVILGIDFDDIAVVILFTAGTFNDISGFQPHLIAGIQTVITLDLFFDEIFGFDITFTAEGDGTHTVFGTIRIIFDLKGFGLPFGIIRND